MTTARATVIDAAPLADEDAARAWLAGADGDALVEAALATLNRVLHLHRVATADAAVRGVSRAQALVVRAGFGSGEDVAEGRWAAALTLPPPPAEGRADRAAALRPQERLAALLSGRDVALAAEELALEARGQLGADRTREAALTLRAALESALAELVPWAERGDLRRRADELVELRPGVERTAARALESGLAEGDVAYVERVLGRLEAALRARTQAGLAGA